jgi:uncharacterized protein (TIGR04255 family)
MSEALFTLDLKETFPRLARAPIVEAIIHWQARAQHSLDLENLRDTLLVRLPDYGKATPIHRFGVMAKLVSGNEPQVEHHKPNFAGLRLTSQDGHYVMQFLRDGLVFSRTRPYEHWEAFRNAAKQAWQVYRDIAQPTEIKRLGVRFINHIPTVTSETLGRYLREPPTCPSNLPLREFVYQSTFAVPGHPYDIRVIKVMQPSMPELQSSTGLFVDIDVFSTNAIDAAEEEESLNRMRWLKNKVFFTLITDEARQLFEGDG